MRVCTHGSYKRWSLLGRSAVSAGLLNKEIIKRIPKFQNEGVDICKNPEAMCQYDETKWLGAIFYWANNVQGYTWPSQKSKFYESLTKFVESDYDLPSSLVEGADFASGTGNVVNNGFWKFAPNRNYAIRKRSRGNTSFSVIT